MILTDHYKLQNIYNNNSNKFYLSKFIEAKFYN